MRRVLIFVLFLSSIFAVAGPVTITVGLPRTGDVLCKGRPCQIRWSSSGVGDRVKVELINRMGIATLITKTLGTKNDGLLEFTPGDTISDGAYTVAVSSMDGRVRGVSGTFRIDPCLATAKPVSSPLEIMPIITLISPPTPSPSISFAAYIGGYMKVRWTARGRVPSPVTISLHPADCSGTGTYLSAANPAAGEQLVRIPTTVTWSYRNSSIRIGPAFGSPSDCHTFDLMEGPIVIAPTAGAVWRHGESYVVDWRHGSGGGWTTYILLVSEANIRRFDRFSATSDYILAENVPGVPSERRITVPASVAPGRYAIYLSCVGHIGRPASFGPQDGTCSEIFQVVAR